MMNTLKALLFGSGHDVSPDERWSRSMPAPR